MAAVPPGRRQGLGHDQSRVARADNNLAALAAEAGHGEQAWTLIGDVRQTRLTLLDRQPQDAAAWRRLTVTERARADIARLNGAATESVRLAMALLADRRARLGDTAHADTAEAQIVLGQTLLAAGHPTAARRHLEEAADTRRDRFLPTSYRVQEDLIWLAKAALVLGSPRTVLDLLGGQAAETDWFRDQVSFRLGYTARRLLALAGGRARPGRRRRRPGCARAGTSCATGRSTPGSTRWSRTSTGPSPNSRCCGTSPRTRPTRWPGWPNRRPNRGGGGGRAAAARARLDAGPARPGGGAAR